MSTKSRTIDNLGIEASNQYAIQKEGMDSRIISESKLVSTRTEVSVTAPYTPSEFDVRFAAAPKHVMWAILEAPANYSVVSSRLFSYALIPSLGGSEKLQADLDKLTGLKSSVPDDTQAQYKTLLDGLQRILQFENTFERIKAFQNQYQKG